MNTKSALIIAGGMVALGILLNNGLGNVMDNDRIVSVKGLAEMEVPADKVIWPIAYQELGNDLNEVYRTVNSKNSVIVSFLKQNGIDEADITVTAPKLTDMNANQYSNNMTGYRYNIKSCVTVASSNVDLVRKLIARQAELLQKGVGVVGNDYEYPLLFEFTGLNDIKPKMIEEATKKARESAEKFAKDSESDLGKIKRAYQGQFSIEDRDANTPYIKKVRVVSSIDYYLE